METVVITLFLDPHYREKAKALGVNFEDYLAGILIEHMLSKGEMDQLIERIERGSVAAKIEAHNLADLGKAMKGFSDGRIN